MAEFKRPVKVVPVVMGVFTYFMAVDAEGYPVAQGSEEVCRQAAERENSK